jgi:hypothetical protein
MKKRVILLSTLITIALITPVTHDVGVHVDIVPKVDKEVKPRTKATMQEKRANKIMAMRYAQVGWGWDKTQRACIHKIFMKESRFDHLAKNQQGSSAYGIAQMLGEKSKDPAVQILRAYRYIVHRYGTPCNAWRHHSRGWY